MNLILQISSKCGQGGRASRNPKILQMSYLEAPLAKDLLQAEILGEEWTAGIPPHPHPSAVPPPPDALSQALRNERSVSLCYGGHYLFEVQSQVPALPRVERRPVRLHADRRLLADVVHVEPACS